MSRAAVATAMAALLLFVGCSAGVGQTPAATSAPAASGPPASTGAASEPPGETPSASPVAEETAWQRAIGEIGEDGRYSLEAALTLFATAYGPLPGVNVEPDLSGEEHVDGTLAIQAVMGHANALTDEQRNAIDAYLAPPTDAEVITIPPVAESRSRIALAALDTSTKAALEEAARTYRRDIATKLRRDFSGDIKVFWKEDVEGPITKAGGHALADAWSDWPGGTFGDCHIRIFQGGVKGELIQILATVAHEVFHCFQLDAFRTPDSYAITPGWVLEGQAAWVENELTSGVGCCLGRWYQWIETQVPLTQRLYDAMGFYAHLAETGTDPWSIFKPMWDAGSDNALIFNQAGANNDTFLNSWASMVLREPDRGAGWNMTGTGIPSAEDSSFSPLAHVLSDGGSVNLSSPFFNTYTQFINLEVDMVHFAVEGHTRISDGSLNTTNLDDVWFCVEGHVCEPPECPPDGFEMPDIEGTISYVVVAASTGGVEGTIGRATGMNIPGNTDECEEPEPEPTDDEFCKRWRALLSWMEQHAGTDYELSQPWAGEISRQTGEMRPFAPAQLVDEVDLYTNVYGTYATTPEPMNVPIVGPQAAGIGMAFMAINTYCGITF